MTQVQVNRDARIRRLLSHLQDDTTDQYDSVTPFGPREFTDPDVAAQERDLIFGRVPSIVAHGSEIPEPNDFMTLRMPRNRVLLVRQRDRSVRAFVNMCRHRGALLEEQESGRCRLFSCPYHRWSYDTDGTLRAITRDNTFGEIDRSQYGLVELPVEERHGFIWLIDAADQEIDVEHWLGPNVEQTVGQYGLDNYVCFRAGAFDEPANWKIMQDAFLDGYHIQYAHPNTAAKHVHTNALAFEDFGRHTRFTSPRKTIDRWLAEDPGDQDLSDHVIETHFLGPNSTLLRHASHFELLTFRPHPTDPGQSRMEMRLIVPRLEASGKDERSWQKMWEKAWEILQQVLYEEDFPLLRSSQKALESADAGSMVLGTNEVANQVFRREVRRFFGAHEASA